MIDGWWLGFSILSPLWFKWGFMYHVNLTWSLHLIHVLMEPPAMDIWSDSSCNQTPVVSARSEFPFVFLLKANVYGCRRSRGQRRLKASTSFTLSSISLSSGTDSAYDLLGVRFQGRDQRRSLMVLWGGSSQQGLVLPSTVMRRLRVQEGNGFRMKAFTVHSYGYDARFGKQR